MKLNLVLVLLWAVGAGFGGAAEAPRIRPGGVAGIGRMVGEAQVIDVAGRGHALSALVAAQPFTVIAMTSPTCPLSRKFAPSLAVLEDAWKGRGVQFIFAGAIVSDAPEALAALAREHAFDGLCASAADASLRQVLQAESTAEVFVLDRARTLHYRGAVDDQYGLGYQKDQPSHAFLGEALAALSQGQRPAVEATTAPGCVLESEAAGAAGGPTWHRDIARLIQRNCQECHRPGGTGPFAMMTMAEVVGHAGMIRKVVREGLMPPWFAAHGRGPQEVVWANERGLGEADRAALLGWLSGDRAEGDPGEAPLPREWPEEWVLGKPDAVVALPEPVAVAATGRMKYQYREVASGFAEDRWITGVEVRPSALAQVHHVLVFAVPEGKKGVVDGDDFLAVYVPGSSAVVYPPGYAKKLPGGARIVFQLHYTPNGSAVEDRTRLGLTFAAAAPRHEVHVAAAKQTRFCIPPGARRHEVRGALPIPFGAQILSLMPHMHMRGAAFRYELVDAGGQRRELLDVPRYDFNWQLLYRAAEPIAVEAGSRIEATAWFDNSAENPNNPDPTAEVRWGDQTEEEMMIGYVEYVKVAAAAGAVPGDGE